MSKRLTIAFDKQLELAGLGRPVPELRFHPIRRWRFDWALPDHKLAVEVDGGVFVQGRHSRGAGVEKDCEKYAEALKLGWKVLRVTPRHVRDGRALQWVEEIVRQG